MQRELPLLHRNVSAMTFTGFRKARLRRPRVGQHQVVLDRSQGRLRDLRQGANGRAHKRAGGGVRSGQDLPSVSRRAVLQGQDAVQDHQGAYVASGSGSGWYVQISSAGVYTAVGYHEASSEALAAIGRSPADRSGADLSELVAGLQRKGWTRGGETLKTRPQGYAADHPRIELLRYESLVLSKNCGVDEVIHTPKLLAMIRSSWRAARPFVAWVGTHSQS